MNHVAIKAALLILLAIPGIHKSLLRLEASALSDCWEMEFGVACNAAGKCEFFDGDRETVRVPVKADTVFVAHTQSDATFFEPTPYDLAEAKRTGIPIVVISQRHAWIIYADGTTEEGK